MEDHRHQKNIRDFWSLVDKRGPTECWPWKGKIDSSGYGWFTRRPYGQRAHQWAYALAGLKVPPGHELDHTCRLRSCTNPAHIEAVTHAENIRRAIGKLPPRPRPTHCQRGHPLPPRDPSKKNNACHTCWIAAAKNWKRRKSLKDPDYDTRRKRLARANKLRVKLQQKSVGVG